ncbi:alpha/beta hydrolase [Dactylosporangium sp. NPDC005572]|uniref:alpha/beta hydrolase n=1 Tax=Dactylosporangium sp. NPDC005572 TaxID=3156889 RepID=UPI0033A4C206
MPEPTDFGPETTTRPANALILHGKPGKAEFYDPAVPSPSNHHWLPWLAKQLIVRDIPAHTPELPLAYAPDYPAWRHELERYDITPRTLFAAHSCGAGFLLRWLGEHPHVTVGRVVLVAPWLDPTGRQAPGFFDAPLDRQVAARTGGLTVFHSADDFDEIQVSVRTVRDSLAGLRYREFHGYGHFARATFPELLAALVD